MPAHQSRVGDDACGDKLAQQADRLRHGYCRLTGKMHSATAMRKMETYTLSDLAKIAEALELPRLHSARDVST